MALSSDSVLKDAGYWPREKVREMDILAQAQMLRFHPMLASPELKRSLNGFFRKHYSPLYMPPNPSVLLSKLFELAPYFIDPSEAPGTLVMRADRNAAKEIKKKVAAKHRLTVADLESQGRNKTLAYARFEAIFLIASETRLSWPAIGRLFGGRDHTSAMYAAWRHATLNKLVPPRGLDKNYRGKRGGNLCKAGISQAISEELRLTED